MPELNNDALIKKQEELSDEAIAKFILAESILHEIKDIGEITLKPESKSALKLHYDKCGDILEQVVSDI